MKKRTANVHGGSREPERGTWCTPKWLAELVGPWDLDPFSNPRSHVVSRMRCMLEDGGDGLGDHTIPGTFFQGGARGLGPDIVGTAARVWFQPPYTIVLEAFEHYKHTRFGALLRFDPSTEWFSRIYRASELVCVPRRRRVNFEPPPGIRSSSSSVPHALFYRRAEDATPAVLRACIAWRPR
ncbi:MAG TPA: hypothetical protein VM513_35460 [Kofleriaceae bacterium]|nr:hypothetical protein [Kofleriaceae bacterium]